MNKKRSLLTVLALVLVCAMSVMGTAAYLKHNTTAVTNTFIAAGGGKLADSLTLTEHEVTKGTDGGYTIANGAKTTNTNSYDVMPGMVLPKDPTITITGKTTAPAYLYLEVCGELPTAYEWNLDSAWNAVMDGQTQATGNNGGKLYVYKDVIATASASTDYNVIADKKVTVNSNPTDLNTTESKTLSFYAYLAQANVGDNSDALTVYNTCFPTTTP